MRRVRYYTHGDPEVLQIEEVEIPTPGQGQVLLKTEVVGTSYVDTAMRRGASVLGQPPLPGSPHGDVVGTVQQVGEGVDAALIGHRMVGRRSMRMRISPWPMRAGWPRLQPGSTLERPACWQCRHR